MTTVPTTDLGSLMSFIGEGFPFTQDHYPNADLSTPERIRAFAVRHSSAHMAKTGGRIAAEAEEYDHGGAMDEEVLKVAATKMFVTAVNFARALGMSPEELVGRVPVVMKVI